MPTEATASEIPTVLASRVLKPEPTLEIVKLGSNNSGFEYVADITSELDIRGSSIQRNSYDPLGGTAQFNLRWPIDEFDVRRHYLRAKFRVVDSVSDKYVEKDMGVYIPRIPSTIIEPQISYPVSCVDVTTMLDNDMRIAFSTQNNQLARVAIEEAYKLSECPLSLYLPNIDYIFSDEYGETWLASEGISWLECINDLLRSTGNIGVYSNRLGNLESRPYYFLDESTPVWTFNNSSGVGANTEVEENFWEVPNRWTGIADQSSFTGQLNQSVYTLTNESDGITSRSATGRTIDRTFNVEVVSREGLENTVRWRAQLDRQLSLRLRIENSMNPMMWVGDVVAIDLPALGVTGVKGVVESWNLPMDGSTMFIEVEVPV